MDRETSKKLISIICPVHNEAPNIAPFFARLSAVLSSLDASLYDWELLFTNNCSQDGTLLEIQRLRESERRIRVLTFSRNFGYQCSVFAGLENARGDLFMIIDVDCEDPPEMLREFLVEQESGFDIVYGKRAQRDEARWMHEVRKVFYRLNRFLADYEVVLDMAEFFMINRAVRDAVTSNKSNFPFLRSEIGYVGFSKKGITYKREARKQGRSHYNLWGNFGFAAAGILSSTTLLLRVAGYVGVPLLGIHGLFFIWNAMLWMVQGRINTVGFSFLILLDLAFVVYTAIFCSLYIARIYKNSLKRPLYFIDRKNSSL